MQKLCLLMGYIVGSYQTVITKTEFKLLSKGFRYRVFWPLVGKQIFYIKLMCTVL